MQARVEGLGRDPERIHALEQDQEAEPDRAEPESDRRAGHEDEDRGDENEDALGGRVHIPASLIETVCESGSMPKGGSRPVTSSTRSTTYCSVSTPRPIGIAP